MKPVNLTGSGKLLAAAGLALLLTACGGGGGDSAGGGGSFSLSLTDAPVMDLDKVCVTFTEVIIHPSGGGEDIVVNVADGEDSPGCRDAGADSKTLDLKSLGEGNSVMLVDEHPLQGGNYSWIRLVVDPDNTYVVVDEGGAELLLDCSSCDESHLKLNRSFSIEAQGWVAFTIDFDLRKSITLSNRNKPNPQDFDYKLRPTLRIVDTAMASSFIWGFFTDARTEPTECSVYVYEGDVAPDDICMTTDPQGAPVDCPGDGARPYMSANVVPGGTDYDYRTGFLYPGLYTIALMCDYDDPDVDDDLLFYDTTLVDAQAGATGTQQDLGLSDNPSLGLDKQITAGDPFTATDDVIGYDYVVANNGNVSLVGPVVVTDDRIALVTCPDVSSAGNADGWLNPGESLVCTGTYTVTADDVTAGSVTNIAFASADGVDSVTDTETASLTAP
jgi:hypothetical protein